MKKILALTSIIIFIFAQNASPKTSLIINEISEVPIVRIASNISGTELANRPADKLIEAKGGEEKGGFQFKLIDFLIYSVVGGAIGSILAVIAVFVVRTWKRKTLFSILFGATKLVLPELRQSGLVNVHSSMDNALQDIELSIEKTHNLSILSNKGIDWVGQDISRLSKVLRKKVDSSLNLRMLLLSKDAPWLPIYAKEKAQDLKHLIKDFENAHNDVESYVAKNANFLHHTDSKIYYHRDHPIWRLIITDDRVFVASYTNDKPAREGIVLEFKYPNGEIFGAFKRYFEFLWSYRGIARGQVADDTAIRGPHDNFERSVGAVVYSMIAGDKKILLLKRKIDGLYVLPKGHLEENEKLEEAALREILEETSLPKSCIKIELGLGWYPNPLIIGEGGSSQKKVYYYLARYVGNELTKLRTDSEHESANWYSLDDLSKLKYAYSHIKDVLHDALDTSYNQ